jgi:murein DD-endopeptidase MepM/ murein hydrolase activator NlpD
MSSGYRLAGLLGCAVLCIALGCKSASLVMNLPTQVSAPAVIEPVQPASPTAPVATSLPATEPPVVPTTAITATAPASTPCSSDLCAYPGMLFLRRPIDPPANDSVDMSYRFGSTQSHLRDPHHGVEFLNRLGTPVLAAADGKVVVAGTDLEPTSAHGVWPITFYGLYSNFYGNLVVIEHPIPAAVQSAFPEIPAPLYTLYGHLSAIEVQPGQEVKAGQEIGKVGMAGIATGSHLHFEVRLGENSYKTSRNPELWLAPHTDPNGQQNGALAGRFLNTYNTSLDLPSVVLQHLPSGPDGPSDFDLSMTTYEEKGLLGQAPFLESFGAGDLPAGWYRITFPMNGLRKELVQVFPGQLTVVTFRWKE